MKYNIEIIILNYIFIEIVEEVIVLCVFYYVVLIFRDR